MNSITELLVWHKADYPWQFVNSENKLQLTVRIEALAVKSIKCFACDPCNTHKGHNGEDLPNLLVYEMECAMMGTHVMYYKFELPMKSHKLRYHFLIETSDGIYMYDETGISNEKEELYIRPFFVSYTYKERFAKTPEWCNGMIWYQIFPDRFASDKEMNNIQWEYEPITDKDVFYGGTIKGITSKISYLKQLGVNGIYLNPIFNAASIHRYDTIDYSTIDETLGTEQDFKELCEECHSNQIRIMLDGVFNHCSFLMPQFQDVIKHGKDSAYFNWFIIYNEEQISQLDIQKNDVYNFRRNPLYETFAFVPSMPKLNTGNPEVIEYLTSIAEKWTRKYSIDAWRLDVPDEINDLFLKEFYRRIKHINSDIYIIGEIWGSSSKWLRNEIFDGVMNYPLYFIVRDFIAREKIDAKKCAQLLIDCFMNHPDNMKRGMFNFCSTHDTPRMMWHCGNDKQKLGLCYILVAAMGNQLSVYYGDEIGMEGGYDPDNRRCFPWKNEMSMKIEPNIVSAMKLVMDTSKGAICGVNAIDKDVIAILYSRRTLYINRSGVDKILPDGTKIFAKNYVFA